jgi:tRNA-splicing ligase RtcB (3'-phosphate/5'-hydroxy nucleic acid ligase)
MKEKKIYDYSLDIDEQTLNQFKECYSHDFVETAALMPDAHVGYAAPIGSVLITKDYVVPAWVGFDIGCGLIAMKIQGKNIFEKIKDNEQKIHRTINNKIPMGVGEYNKIENISEKTKKQFNSLIKKFKEKPYNKEILQYLNSTALKHLGTLGGGNHFIELGYNSLNKKINKNEVWLIIHSGSRGIGYKVAKRYMISASENKDDYEKTFPLDVKSQLGKEYLNILDFALDYALLNRLEMASKVIEVISEVLNEKIKSSLWANKNHNHAVLEKGKFIHRKGATPAKKGEKGIIPGNMRDGTYLIEGKGCSKFLYSSSHGAGRALSRSSAMKKITLKEFEDSMKGIRANIGQRLIDEAPMAYKDIEKVMSLQKPSVKILKKIKPIMNWKGK